MKKIFILIFSLSFFNVFAHISFQTEKEKTVLDNGIILREILVSGDSIITLFVKLNA